MAVSIDNYLRNLSNSYYLKNDSDEVTKINKSVDAMLANLNRELGEVIKRKFVFGSYDRDTILPRTIDAKSDIDLMVVFNHTEYERNPGTYRKWLKDFADKYYANRYGSEVIKSSPTVTVRLNNINYDLVPAKEVTYALILPNELYIPKNDTEWRETDPNDVKKKLTEANQKYNSIVRPIIRLMKAWNCVNGYPYDSYLLEKDITGMYFQGDNYQTGFIWAVNHINTTGVSVYTKGKVDSLRYNITNVIDCLNNNNLERAKHWLHRVLPY